jgi:predicted phage baseplate assembly protein
MVVARSLAGGAAAETIADAARRAFDAVATTDRAVTVADYERLALATPGTAIARVRALSGVHPAFPCYAAPGIVTVVVVPNQRRAKPTPSRGLLTTVRSWLNRQRIVGTRVEVVGPVYLTVSVSATIRPRAAVDAVRVAEDVRAALDTFLDPLRGGPRSEAPGWPFGRDVYRSEVLQVIDGVPGVDAVLRLELAGDRGTGADTAVCANLCVGPVELVSPGQHTIEVEPR